MALMQIIVLAIIQGLSEFLPISSSAHLILPAEVLGWQDQGLAFDVAVHVGSLVAVMVYFRQDIVQLTSAWFSSVYSRKQTSESLLGWYIILATIPVGLAGVMLNDFIESHLRSIAVIAVTTLLFGVLLGLADKFGRGVKQVEHFSWQSALMVGLAQVLALIPGTSRSGITMTAALAMGFDRQAAARFSFLLSIPVIALSGGYKAFQLVQLQSAPWGDMFLGAVLSGITAYLCIKLFLAWINRVGMMPFVWYRMLLGGVLLWIIFSA